MSALARLLMGLALMLGLAIIPASFSAPAAAQSCPDLVVDGGFEMGGAWQPGPSPIVPQYVTYAKHSGNRSLALGITSGANIASYSSARQMVTIPATATQATLTFWFFAMASAPATTDYMELVLLDTAGAILSKPWNSHNDSRLWNQMSFDLTPWRGQTVQLYFNVFNDGLGGKAGMFLDDVALTSCAGYVTIVPSGTVTGSPIATTTPTATPTGMPTPGCVNAIVNGDFATGLASWQQVGDPAGVAPVTNPVHSTPYAIQLGSQVQNLNGLASIRQLVTIPAGYPQATLSVWVYTVAQPGAGADYQEVALLNSSGVSIFVPWRIQGNNQAWTQLLFDVSGFAGQSVFVSFSVNNDGTGGRTAMVVDDARLLSCNAGPGPTPTPTRTSTPWALATSTATPPIAHTPLPPGCFDLLQNGGFEDGWSAWMVPYNPIMPQIVNWPVFSGTHALQVGSQTQNASSYSSARQWVTVPWTHPRVVLQFWAYTWAESLSGEDEQHVVLLEPGDTVKAKPWSTLANRQMWEPHSYDLIGVSGQTFAVYFNAINDGRGGRTALFVDDAHLWVCTSGVMPLAMAAGPIVRAALPTPPAVVVVAMTPDAMPVAPVSLQGAPIALPVAPISLQGAPITLPVAPVSLQGAPTTLPVATLSLASTTPSPDLTRVAVAPPTQMFAGVALAEAPDKLPSVETGLFGRINLQEVLQWFVIAAAIVIVFLFLLWLLRRLFGNPNP